MISRNFTQKLLCLSRDKNTDFCAGCGFSALVNREFRRVSVERFQSGANVGEATSTAARVRRDAKAQTGIGDLDP